MTNRKDEKRSWIVRMRCTIIKDVIVNDCTREEAENQTWGHAVDEEEIDQLDAEVIEVTPND